jgi:hypothetical protein
MIETTIPINQDDVVGQCLGTDILHMDVGSTIGMDFWRADRSALDTLVVKDSLQEHHTLSRRTRIGFGE